MNPLRQPAYRSLYAAQLVALTGTGLLTVALGLFAYDIAGSKASAVLGIAMTVKMLAYVFISPVMAALTRRWQPKRVLIACDLVRAGVACLLPLVTTPAQIYVLVFVLQAASATFTPTFQALIPQLLPEEGAYTRALSLSRLAYNLESIVSPMIAALLLLVMHYNTLFVGTAFGFLASAALILPLRLPGRGRVEAASEPFTRRVGEGVRLFLATPTLRRVLAMYFATACATAMLVVNTPTLVRHMLGQPQTSIPLLLGAAGVGEVLAALVLPRYLDKRDDLGTMRAATTFVPSLLLAAGLFIALAPTATAWAAVLTFYVFIGAATSTVLTPAGRVLRRNAQDSQLSAVFAADFSLSHSCYLVTYLVAGLTGAAFGVGISAIVLAVLAIPAIAVLYAHPGRETQAVLRTARV